VSVSLVDDVTERITRWRLWTETAHQCGKLTFSF